MRCDHEKRVNERCHGGGMQVAYVSNVTQPRDAIQHRASWHRADADVGRQRFADESPPKPALGSRRRSQQNPRRCRPSRSRCRPSASRQCHRNIDTASANADVDRQRISAAASTDADFGRHLFAAVSSTVADVDRNRVADADRHNHRNADTASTTPIV